MIQKIILVCIIFQVISSFSLKMNIISSAPAYNLQLSKDLQAYNILTHCSKTSIQTWTCPLCKKLPTPQTIRYFQNKATNIVGYAGYLPGQDKIFINFRGTQDITNWLQDFSFKQVQYRPCANCKIHQGFYLSFLSVSPLVYNIIDQLNIKYPNRRIIVAGSSLGGALAQVAALQIQLKYKQVQELHALGCPRVGDINFAKFAISRIPNTFRVIHDHDIVPHVPLVSQNFHHPPFEVLFDANMQKYRICDASGEDQGCSNRFFPNYTAKDHVNYWVNLDVKEICGV